MNKRLKNILFMLILIPLILFFSACGEDEKPIIKTIDIIIEANQEEVYLKEFSLDDYIIKVTMSDGTTKEVDLLKTHISEEDYSKLSTIGEHTITVNYEGLTTAFNVIIKKNVFTGITFEDKQVIYDGEEHSIEVEGVPSFATVTYDKTNSYIDSGTHEVTATISANNYEDLVLTAQLVIQNSSFSDIKFEDKKVIYDGEEHSIEVEGVPSFATVTYDKATKYTEMGVYYITAIITADNYEDLVLTAKLVIQLTEIDGLTFPNATYVYDGEPKSLEVVGALPEGVEVEYLNNGKINAGTYTITAVFSASGEYEHLPNITATLTIEKKELNIKLEGKTDLKYTGTAQKTISALGLNLVGTDTVNIELVYSGDMIEAGVYTATATINDNNYKLTKDNTITINITRESHELTFEQDGFENVVISVLDLENATSLIPAPRDVLGYNVVWENVDLTSITSDMTISSIKTPITYTITYHLNDALNSSLNPTSYTIESERITLNAPQQKLEMAFVGWYTTSNFAVESKLNRIESGTTGDLNLYAKWEYCKIENQVDFEIDYTSETPIVKLIVASDVSNIDLSFKVIVSSDCTWKLYKDFSGNEEYKLKSLSLNYGDNKAYLIVFHSDSQHYTRYELSIYRLRIFEYVFMNDGSEWIKGKAEEKSVIIAPASPSKTAYNFVGWAIDNEMITFPYEVTESVVITATYTPIEYDITYHLNGGNLDIHQITYTIEDEVTLSLIPQKDYYDFIGWYTNSSFTGEVVLTINKGTYGDKDFYAKWNPIEYIITYDLDNGVNNLLNPNTYTIESSLITFKIPTRQGYSFVGWYKDSDKTEPITAIETGSHENITIYAKWEPNLNTLHFDGNGATSGIMEDMRIKSDQKVNLITNLFVRTGYEFIGWSLTSDGEVEYNNLSEYIIGLEEEYTLYAVWDIVEYSIIYHLGNGEINNINNPETYTIITPTIIFDTPTKHGGTFLGWYSDEKLENEVVEIANGSYGDINIYPKWEEIVYNVQYLYGTEIPNNENPTTFVVSQLPIKLKPASYGDYYFVGWYSDSQYNKEITEITTIEDKVIYAKFIEMTDGLEYTLDDSTYIVTGYTGEDEIIYIPKKYNNKLVTGIASELFKDNTTITKIMLPNSIENISSDAFKNCTSLVGIYFKGTIEEWSQISFGNSFSNPLRYAHHLYINDEEVTEVNITTATKINDNAFYGASWITSVTLGNSVTSIGEYAFDGALSITSITIPNSVIAIGNYAFSECISLKRVNYVGTIEEWSQISFGNSFSNPLRYAHHLYINDIEIANVELTSVTKINGNAFYGASSIISVTIGNSVTSIGDDAFKNCTSLERLNYTGTIDEWVQISFGNSFSNPLGYAHHLYINDEEVTEVNITTATKINDNAFYGASWITSVTIGYSVTSIGSYSFYGTTSIINITIPNSVTYIGDYAFFESTSITSITIPNSVKTIGNYAFVNCHSLININIGESVEIIGKGSFVNCSSLTSITIPNSVISIMDDAFEYCYSLREVINKSNLDIVVGSDSHGRVAYYAYQVINEENNSNLIYKDNYVFYKSSDKNYQLIKYIGEETNIMLPDDINGSSYSIGSYAFFEKNSITSVTIPNNVTNIGEYAFYNCKLLTSITIPNSVVSIGNKAFEYCYSLREVINKSNLDIVVGSDSHGYVAQYAYQVINEENNSNLIYKDNYVFYKTSDTNYQLIKYIGEEANIILPDDINGSSYSIGSYAFYDCKLLTSITIPNNVRYVSDNAFTYCTSLKKVNYIGTIDEWAQINFYGADSNPLYYAKHLYINDKEVTEVNLTTATQINSYAFLGGSFIKSITIPNNVKSIGNNAFTNCTSLKKVNYIGTIDEWAQINFYSADSNPLHYAKHLYINDVEITEVNLTTATQISSYAFLGAISIMSVKTGNSVTHIGEFAFYDCSSIISITIGERVTIISDYAFSYCHNLKEVINQSDLNITAGNTDYGYVGFYADTIIK